MQRARMFLVLSLVLMLQACITPTQIENTAIINTRGIDILEEDGNRLIETTISPYLFDPQAEDMTSLLIGRGQTIKEARVDAGRQASYTLSPGKISVDFYGREAAEAGILPLLNTLIRDARVSDRMQMVITNGTAREILELEQEKVTVNTTEYFHDLISKEVKLDILPRNTLEYYTRFVEQVGIDPILPIIDNVDDWPTLVGAALFQKDRYVGQISLEEAFLINQLRKRVKNTPLRAPIPLENYRDQLSDEIHEEYQEQIHVSLELNNGRGTILMEKEEELAFKANIKMKAKLLETSYPMEIQVPEIAAKIEKDLENYYEEKYQTLFKKVQELGSDPFGLGRKYTTTRTGSKINQEEWIEKYEEATLDIDVEFTLVHFGTID